MTTKEITEAILFQCPDVYPIVYAMHVLSEDRQWIAKEHKEFPFIKYFTDPKFIVIIDKQIHIYIVGDADKKKSSSVRYKRHIINLEGYHADYMVLSRNELSAKIKETAKEKLFLPDGFYDRIIYMHKDECAVFNRVTALNSPMFTTKSKWTVGADTIYDATFESKVKEKNTNAYEILNEIYAECF